MAAGKQQNHDYALQFFASNHLAEPLRQIVEPFNCLARYVVNNVPAKIPSAPWRCASRSRRKTARCARLCSSHQPPA
jgi:hypothetical protein